MRRAFNLEVHLLLLFKSVQFLFFLIQGHFTVHFFFLCPSAKLVVLDHKHLVAVRAHIRFKLAGTSSLSLSYLQLGVKRCEEDGFSCQCPLRKSSDSLGQDLATIPQSGSRRYVSVNMPGIGRGIYYSLFRVLLLFFYNKKRKNTEGGNVSASWRERRPLWQSIWTAPLAGEVNTDLHSGDTNAWYARFLATQMVGRSGGEVFFFIPSRNAAFA